MKKLTLLSLFATFTLQANTIEPTTVGYDQAFNSTDSKLAYDSVIAHSAHLKKVDNFTIESKRNFNDFAASGQENMVNVIVEIPTGTSAKWELNKDNKYQIIWEYKKGAPRIVNYLGYPGNYGTVPQTSLPKELGGDGDPLDVIVLGQAAPRGEVVAARLIGVLKMLDNGEQDDKLIAVLSKDSPFEGVKTLKQLDEEFVGVKDIINIWFANYKGSNGGTKVLGWGNEQEANHILHKAKMAYSQLKN